MRLLAALFSFCLFVGGASAAQQASTEGANPMSKPEDVHAVAPALDRTSFFRIDKAMSSLPFVASAGRFTGYDPG